MESLRDWEGVCKGKGVDVCSEGDEQVKTNLEAGLVGMVSLFDH